MNKLMRQARRCGCLMLVSAALMAMEEGTDLSIDDAIELALTANNRFLNLIDQSAVSELDYESARSVYKTRFGSAVASDARSGAEVGSRYSLFMDKRNESGSGYRVGMYNSSFGDDNLSELRFSYTLPFFNNTVDANQLNIHQAQINAARSQRMMEIGKEELANQVVSAYLRLAMATRAEQLARDAWSIAESFYQAQVIRERAGERSPLELTEAELKRIDAQQSVEIAELERTSQEDGFRLLLGMHAYEPIEIHLDILNSPDLEISEQALPDLEAHAVANRVELLAKREELSIINKRIESTRLGKLPPIEVSLQYALVGEGDGLEDSLDLNDQRFGVGVRMDTDLQNTRAKIKQRKLYLQRRTQRREMDYLERTVKVDVRKAYSAARRARSKLDYVTQYQRLAEQKYEQADILFRRGDLNELELFESRYETTKARHRVLAARVDYLMAEQSLAMASGHRRF